LDLIEGWKFLDWLRNCQLLKNCAALYVDAVECDQTKVKTVYLQITEITYFFSKINFETCIF
jgi:hypothetical protein